MNKRGTEDKDKYKVKIITRGYIQALLIILGLVIVNQMIDESAFSIFLIFIVIILLMIFLKAQKSLLSSFETMEECRDNMMNLFQRVPVAMFLIDEVTSNVLLMNQIAEELTIGKKGEVK